MKDESNLRFEISNFKSQISNFKSEISDSDSSSAFRLPPSSFLKRVLLVCLFGVAVCAPFSIAATQIWWGVGLVVWTARFCVRPRSALVRTPVDYALLAFFVLTGLSAFLSYAPDMSIGKLRGASLFTIVYLISQNVTRARTVRRLAITLVAACMVTVLFTLAERAVGRGIKLNALTSDSPLHAAGVGAGDTLLEARGVTLRHPNDFYFVLAITSDEMPAPLAVRAYRHETVWTIELDRALLLRGDETMENRLGIAAWSRGREWRASGFFGRYSDHNGFADNYVTYAEALQLVLSLTFGLFVAVRRKRSRAGVLLGVAVIASCGALFLTVTRASWVAFLLSAFVIVAVGAAKRRVALLMMTLALLLVVPAGLFFLAQKRNVGFLDRTDGSTRWRMTVYREAFGLLVSNPRHLILGVGMDSIKRYYLRWEMFDSGRLPVSHLHSTPLQIAVERGLPALAAWLALLFVYGRMLWRLARKAFDRDEWIERGIILGALGGLIGFTTSGLVHYNLGDSEVATIFYFIMGLTLVIERLRREREEKPELSKIPAAALRRAA